MRKNFLLNDIYVIQYGNKTCTVKCPKCGVVRTVSTSDYYKKRKNGIILCRTCNKPNNRKNSIELDDQIKETIKEGKQTFVIAKCGKCSKEIKIHLGSYWRVKERDKTWVCQECRKPDMIEKSKNNPIFQTEEYKEQFRLLHKNPEYYGKVHNQKAYSKISDSTKINWKNNRENHMVHRQTKEFRDRISKWSKKQWEEKGDIIRSNNEANFINKAQSKHKHKYSYGPYSTNTERIAITCKCGYQFTQLPATHLRSCYCPSCNMSQAQREIAEYVSQFTFCTINDRGPLSPQEIDVYVPSHNLGIEYHGLWWHSYGQPETTQQKLRHQTKWLLAKQNNIVLLQILENEWIQKQEIVKSIISNKLGLSKKLNARSCKIVQISNTDANQFFNNNHLSGSRSAKIAIALKSDDKTLMAISATEYKNGKWEIIRMAAKNGILLRGGVSKLIKALIKEIKPNEILTYANLRYSTGAGYINAGFKECGYTKPGYFYIRNKTIMPRQQFQKHKLHKLLENFDSNLTESENMFNHGFRRLWDAGHLRFIL